jgi:hypothetical protein
LLVKNDIRKSSAVEAQSILVSSVADRTDPGPTSILATNNVLAALPHRDLHKMPNALSWVPARRALISANTVFENWIVSVAGAKFEMVTWPKWEANANSRGGDRYDAGLAVRARTIIPCFHCHRRYCRDGNADRAIAIALRNSPACAGPAGRLFPILATLPQLSTLQTVLSSSRRHSRLAARMGRRNCAPAATFEVKAEVCDRIDQRCDPSRAQDQRSQK